MEYLGNFGNNSLIFGTWNVRGLTEKKRETFSEIERENVDVVILTETKLKETGSENYGKYVHLYSGVRKKEHGQAGVSILMKKDLGFIESWEAVNERIIKADLNIHGQKITIMGVYWLDETPKTKDDSQEAETKDDFQKTFEEKLKNVTEERKLIILGDFNSRVENFDSHLARLENECEQLEQKKLNFPQQMKLQSLKRDIIKINQENANGARSEAVGSFGVEGKKSNNNGDRLMDVCAKFKLKIQNTFFDHKNIHTYTWYKKNDSSRSVIDFCITRQITALHVHDVLACRWFDCGTDHIFLAAFITIPSKKCKKSPFPKISESREHVTKKIPCEMRKYKTYLLYSDTLREKYENQVDFNIKKTAGRKLKNCRELENCGTTEEMYHNLKKSIHLAAEKVLGIQNKDIFGEFLWDKEIKYLRARRDSPYGITFDSNFDEKIKNEVWQGACSAVENTELNKRSKMAWSILHEMRNKNNETVLHQKPLEDFWKRNGIDIRDVESRKINRYRINPKETVKINLKDVTKALEQLDDDAWPVPGGLSIQLLRNSTSETKYLLTNLIQKIFNGEKIPSEIDETYINENTTNDIDLHVHCIMRVMCFILKERLENEIYERNCRSILLQTTNLDTTFMLRIYLQKIAEKEIPSSHIAFVDLKQVYFGIDYSQLFEILEKYGISEILLAVLEHLFKSNTIRGIETNKLSQQFILSKGLIEQSVLGPTLLKIYIQESINEWQRENRRIKNVISSSMIYDDKVIVIARRSTTLKTMILNLKKHLKILGLNISLKNLKYLGNKKLRFGHVIFYGQNVIDFDGTSFELRGGNCEEVSHRILETKNAIAYLHPVLRDEDISLRNKERIFETILTHILINGCEAWTLDSNVKKLMDKNLLERNYWKWCFEDFFEDYISNELFHKLLLLRKTEWYLKRSESLETNKWFLKFLKWEAGGTRRVQRPKKQWMDDIHEELRNTKVFKNYYNLGIYIRLY
ncbi:hypothetical protein HNY73_020741 [Argiope bruennichi]|uniref:Reverse transcriptase domain-containing protein n=1 Tax=Argiope bruennichi TaxID=94029 RepID=A0A8T0ECF8_ARGBR|nr:hypothetical protein HNY73_020741 [Argiope bruennichi]